MTAIDSMLQAAASYTVPAGFDQLSGPPSKDTVVLTCMDCRIPIAELLGFRPGEVTVLRNAGGLVTDDAIRSLVLAQHAHQSTSLMIINHSECALLGFDPTPLQEKLAAACSVHGSTDFGRFDDLDANVRAQVARVRAEPCLQGFTEVRGFVVDIKTLKLREVTG